MTDDAVVSPVSGALRQAARGLCLLLILQTAQAAELRGTVSEASGTSVTIRLEAGGMPGPGDRLKIVHRVGGTDIEAEVAAGEVLSVKDGVVSARVEVGESPVAVGQLARIEHPDEAVRPAGPDPLEVSLREIPAGEFRMGSPDSDPGEGPGSTDAEKPRHRVRISSPFLMGATEVTIAQFRRFVSETGYKTAAEKENPGGVGFSTPNCSFAWGTQFDWRHPGFAQGDDHPVVLVSWEDAKAFCAWYGKRKGKTCRLPTEAEWEYACRAGTDTRFSSGDRAGTLEGVANLADRSWCGSSADAGAAGWNDGYSFTAPVGRFRPNALGLFDMHGNVLEWCEDWYGQNFYGPTPAVDPRGPDASTETPPTRVQRGGAFFEPAVRLRCARRAKDTPGSRSAYCGFRIVVER